MGLSEEHVKFIAAKVIEQKGDRVYTFTRDEIYALIDYIDKLFGKTEMPDSKAYLQRIQNLY